MLKELIPFDRIKTIVKEFLRENFTISKISSCRGGFFNTTYKIKFIKNKSIILQFSPKFRSKLFWHEKDFLRREIFFLKYLRGMSLPISKILYYDFSRKIIDRNYIILNPLEGYNWYYYKKNLSTKENDDLYRELGQWAKKIHSITNLNNHFGFPNPFRYSKNWNEFIFKYTHSLALHNQKYKLITIDKKLTPFYVAKQLGHVFDEIKQPKLIHGDLWPRNILIQKSKKIFHISGILDWERGLWGDPQFEWVFHCLNYDKHFWKGYGKKRKLKNSHLRDEFYKACFLFQAALEEIYYFKRKKTAMLLKNKVEKISEKLLKNI